MRIPWLGQLAAALHCGRAVNCATLFEKLIHPQRPKVTP